jgi:hypothetical protein
MRRLILIAVLVLGLPLGALAQGYTTPPTLQAFQATGLTLPYTAGIATSAGLQQTILAGSVVLTDNQGQCNPPQFAACNFVYWPGSGTILLNTTLPATASVPGAQVIGYVTTAGGKITNIVTGNTTYNVPDGVPIPPGGMRLPVCNALITKFCQASTGSLSGY